jgi:hypothetical protein
MLCSFALKYFQTLQLFMLRQSILSLLFLVQEILWKEGGTVLHPVLSKEPKNGELPNLKVLVPELNILKTGADVSDSIHHNDGDGPCDDDQEQEDGDHDDDDVGEDALEVKDEDEDQDGDSLMPAQRVRTME